MARTHSIERVDFVSSTIPEEFEELGEQLKDMLLNIDSSNHIPKTANRDFSSIVSELYETCGYGLVGDSNSVWGRQHRLSSHNSSNPARESMLRNAAQSFGLVVQDNSDPEKQKDLAIFAPTLNRYFEYQHPINAPNSDVVLAKHSAYDGTETHVEIGGREEILYWLQKVIRPSNHRKESDILEYSPGALPFIEDVFVNEGVSYSIYENSITGIPLYEWSPDIGQPGQLVAKVDHGVDFTLRVHNRKNDGVACGANIQDTSAYRCLRPETVAAIDQQTKYTVEWCGHGACQNRFDEHKPQAVTNE